MPHHVKFNLHVVSRDVVQKHLVEESTNLMGKRVKIYS